MRDGNMRVRLASVADVPTLRLLINAAYQELADMGLNYTGSYQDEQVTLERISKGRAFVLEKSGDIVGTVLFTEKNLFTGRRSGYISQLAIHPRCKGQGLGSFLMDLCEQLARTERYEAIQLDTAKQASHLVNWYLKRGYRVVGELHWDDKTYDSLIFEKEIRDIRIEERTP